MIFLLVGIGGGALFALHRAEPDSTPRALVRESDLRAHFLGVDANVIVYSMTDCPQSASLRAFLVEHAISFDERDVGESLTAREQAKMLGARSVPVLATRGGTSIEGFDHNLVSQVLRDQRLLPSP